MARKLLKYTFLTWVAANAVGFVYGAQHEVRCQDNKCTNIAHRLSHPDRF